MARRDIQKEVNEVIDTPVEEKNKSLLKSQNLLSTGSTLLNLCCTDRLSGGLLKGRYYLFVGQPSSGKTWTSLGLMAESRLHSRFKKYKLFYDDVEVGNNIDIERYFGKTLKQDLQPPEKGRKDEEGQPRENSKTIEEFYDSLESKLDEAEETNNGFIYVLDSMDALSSASALKKAESDKKARKEGKKIETGSYGDGKAKYTAGKIRDICQRLDSTGSILIIVCQEKIDIASTFKNKTFSGGTALTFYSTLQIWFQIKSKITATIKGRKRELGTFTHVKVERNRLTGKRHREILYPVYTNFGVDDIGAMIRWLIMEGHWTGGKSEVSKIDAREFNVKLGIESLARHIQDNGLESELSNVVERVWQEIQDAIKDKFQRRSKYV